jgi:hypothetical protein
MVAAMSVPNGETVILLLFTVPVILWFALSGMSPLLWLVKAGVWSPPLFPILYWLALRRPEPALVLQFWGQTWVVTAGLLSALGLLLKYTLGTAIGCNYLATTTFLESLNTLRWLRLPTPSVLFLAWLYRALLTSGSQLGAKVKRLRLEQPEQNRGLVALRILPGLAWWLKRHLLGVRLAFLCRSQGGNWPVLFARPFRLHDLGWPLLMALVCLAILYLR